MPFKEKSAKGVKLTPLQWKDMNGDQYALLGTAAVMRSSQDNTDTNVGEGKTKIASNSGNLNAATPEWDISNNQLRNNLS